MSLTLAIRWLSAHFAAILVGSLFVFVGVDLLVSGWPAGLGGAGKWIGGIVIVSVIAFATAPIGLTLRLVLGKLNLLHPLAAAVTGSALGLAIIPMLHPSMYPSVTMDNNGFDLVLVHATAGCAGGLAWFACELMQTPNRRGAA